MDSTKKLMSSASNGKEKPYQPVHSSKGDSVKYTQPNTSSKQNRRLLWLDEGVDGDGHHAAVRELRQVMDTLHTFTTAEKCIKFINSIAGERLFVIFSGSLGETTVPLVHDKPQLDSVYIFCQNKVRHEKWARHWPKVKGVFTNIAPICAALEQTNQAQDQQLLSISFVQGTDGTTTKNLNELDKSFMYTHILKEILLTIPFELKHTKEFLAYCRERFGKTDNDLEFIEDFERRYHRSNAITWYSRESFLYTMVNQVLREMDIDGILKTGFFIRDLHEHIARLHSEQFGLHHHSTLLHVYRSQAMSRTAFDQMMNSKGGLISFNNFLSTSLTRNESLRFSRTIVPAADKVRILFVITIDASKSTTPFADVSNQSSFKDEQEILFSMHSIFRIGRIRQIDDNGPLWQVELTSTSDKDPQLYALMECMREETQGATGWLRLGRLLVGIAQYDKAEELYQILDAQRPDEHERGAIFQHLGLIKYHQGKFSKAVYFYEKALMIRQQILSPNDCDLAESYNNIGLVYYKTGEWAKALSFYEKALKIRKHTLPENHRDIAESYNNIGSLYEQTGENARALSFYEKTLTIYNKTLPSNHPHVAAVHNNIGSMYSKLGDYSRALPSLEQALEIYQRILPPDHPDLAASYNNIGLVHASRGDYPKALAFYRKSLEILCKKFTSPHPHLASAHINIGGVHEKMQEYSKALTCHQTALDILKQTHSPNHPDLACCYGHIGIVLSKMGHHAKAVSHCESALAIAEQSLPTNHPQCQSYRRNLEVVRRNVS